MSTSTKFTLIGLFFIMPLFIRAQNLNQIVQLLPDENGLIFGINKNTSVQSIVARTEGLYILTAKDGCYLLSGKTREGLSLLTLPEDRRDVYMQLLKVEPSVFLWANSSQFLNLDQPEAERLEYVGSHFNKNFTVTDIDVDKYGRVFVATANDGMFIFRKDMKTGDYTQVPIRISTVDKQLPSNKVNCLYRDEEDVLWIGTEKGVSTMRENIITNLTIPKEIIKQKWWQYIFGITVNEEKFKEPVELITSWGDCILFANKEYLYKADRYYEELTRLYSFDIYESLEEPLRELSDIMVDIDDNVWLAGNELLMYNITNEQLHNMSENMPFRGRKFLTITEDVTVRSIWIGMERGGLYEYFEDDQLGPINNIEPASSKF